MKQRSSRGGGADESWQWLIPLRVSPMPTATSGEQFDKWLARFYQSSDGKRALAKLVEVARLGPEKPEHSVQELALRCLVSCYFASQFRPADDPGVQYRKRLTRERSNWPTLEKSTAELRSLLAKNPTTAKWAFPREYSLRRRNGLETQRSVSNLLRFLNQYEINLSGRLPELDGGPFFHRFTFACLHYEQAKEKRKARTPDTAGALLFNLVLFFRKWTSRGTVFHGSGDRMPTDSTGRLAGHPCYKVAAELASAALRVSVDERTARTRVESLHRSGVSMIGWPNDARELTKPRSLLP